MNNNLFDVLSVVFWSITYILIIVSGIMSKDERKMAIPYIAIVQNISWELCAVIRFNAFWMHMAWFVLDFIIAIIGFWYLSKKNRSIYLFFILFDYLMFTLLFDIPQGMMLSSFVIDLIMAISFLVERKKLSKKLNVPIAIAKLFGDLSAGLYYMQFNCLIVLITICVLVCNFAYMHFCIKEKEENKYARID